jgi:hypothetical protein
VADRCWIVAWLIEAGFKGTLGNEQGNKTPREHTLTDAKVIGANAALDGH